MSRCVALRSSGGNQEGKRRRRGEGKAGCEPVTRRAFLSTVCACFWLCVFLGSGGRSTNSREQIKKNGFRFRRHGSELPGVSSQRSHAKRYLAARERDVRDRSGTRVLLGAARAAGRRGHQTRGRRAPSHRQGRRDSREHSHTQSTHPPNRFSKIKKNARARLPPPPRSYREPQDVRAKLATLIHPHCVRVPPHRLRAASQVQRSPRLRLHRDALAAHRRLADRRPVCGQDSLTARVLLGVRADQVPRAGRDRLAPPPRQGAHPSAAASV